MPVVPVLVPDLGGFIMEGRVARWLKDVGDSFRTGEALLEIAGHRDAVVVVTAPGGGVLIAVRVPAGGRAWVGATLALIDVW